MTDYTNLYERGYADVKVELAPGGTWRLSFVNAVLMRGKEGKSDQIGFIYSFIEPMGDVDKRTLKDLGDYNFSEDEIAHFFWFSGKRDYAKVGDHVAMHLPKVASIPMLVLGDDGEPKFNPALRAALQGTTIRAKVKIGTYKNEPRNEVDYFLPDVD